MGAGAGRYPRGKCGFVCHAIRVGFETRVSNQNGQTDEDGDALPDRHQIIQRRDIGIDLQLQTGSLHFHRHASTIGQRCFMHLRDGGRTQRFFIEGRKQPGHRRTEFGLDPRTHDGNAHRRQLVVQQLQLFGVRDRQQIAPHRQYLTEFEKHDSQFFERFPHLFRRRPMASAEQRTEEFMSQTREMGKLSFMSQSPTWCDQLFTSSAAVSPVAVDNRAALRQNKGGPSHDKFP